MAKSPRQSHLVLCLSYMKSKLKISNIGKAGGVISDVVEAQLEHKGEVFDVVVKRTHKNVQAPHFSYADDALRKVVARTHVLDRKVLQRLQGHPTVKVPRLHMAHSKGLQTVMSDFNADGYSLMQDRLIEGTLPAITAANTAKTLASLQKALRDKTLMSGIKPVENSRVQIRERLAEAHLLLYGNLDVYRELEAKLLSEQGLLYTDGHPKNLAVNGSGEVMVFDFGRVITGSQQYVPANFLAHIGLACIGGVMPYEKAATFIKDFYDIYDGIVPIEEHWFVKFFAAELVHRGLAMRWVDPRLFKKGREIAAKLAVHAVFLDVYDKGHQTLKQLMESLQRNSDL